MTFENRTVLITGASSGIGKAIAVELSKFNCNIILVSRRLNILENLVTEISSNSEAEFLTLINLIL